MVFVHYSPAGIGKASHGFGQNGHLSRPGERMETCVIFTNSFSYFTLHSYIALKHIYLATCHSLLVYIPPLLWAWGRRKREQLTCDLPSMVAEQRLVASPLCAEAPGRAMRLCLAGRRAEESPDWLPSTQAIYVMTRLICIQTKLPNYTSRSGY